MARREAINEVRPVLEEIDKVTEVVDKGLDAAEKGVDIAAEAVEHGAHIVIEEAHQAVAWFRSPKVAAGVVVVAAGVSAGFLGWHLAKRHFTKKYEAELEREIESARKFFGRLNKVDESGEIVTPEQLAQKHKADDKMEKAAFALKTYQDGSGKTQYNKIDPDKLEDTVTAALEEQEATESNVFLNGAAIVPEAFDLAEEVRKRDSDTPYVISSEEFMENENSFPQNNLTYYGGDDILADERDEVVDNVEALVGTDNLARFGHGSGDKNIVYVRNERNEVEFEIAYSPGKYSEEVHGFIEHSDRPTGTRKFRLRADE